MVGEQVAGVRSQKNHGCHLPFQAAVTVALNLPLNFV
jgi:hypothetical protein